MNLCDMRTCENLATGECVNCGDAFCPEHCGRELDLVHYPHYSPLCEWCADSKMTRLRDAAIEQRVEDWRYEQEDGNA